MGLGLMIRRWSEMDRATGSMIMQAMNTAMLFAVFWIFYLGGWW